MRQIELTIFIWKLREYYIFNIRLKRSKWKGFEIKKGCKNSTKLNCYQNDVG
jgi:hypothetical protein